MPERLEYTTRGGGGFNHILLPLATPHSSGRVSKNKSFRAMKGLYVAICGGRVEFGGNISTEYGGGIHPTGLGKLQNNGEVKG